MALAGCTTCLMDDSAADALNVHGRQRRAVARACDASSSAAFVLLPVALLLVGLFAVSVRSEESRD